MKNLIVLLGALVILLTFPLQYALEQKNHHNLSQLYKFVNNAKEIAKQDGYFTDDNIDDLKVNILNEFDEIEEAEIIINVTRTPKYRVNTFDERELIYYEIGVPLKKIISSNAFWGIEDADNQMTYYIRNYTSSERVAP